MRMQMTGQVQCKWVVKSVQLRSHVERTAYLEMNRLRGNPHDLMRLDVYTLKGNRLANSPLSTQTSSDKNGWKTKPCPQVYPLNKPVSDVGHAEPASGSQSTMASLYTSAPHTP